VKLSRLLLGRRLANREGERKKLGWIEAVPAMGLDSLASSAYGPEAALAILTPAGVGGLIYMGPIAGLLVILLAALYFSYRQTVRAYPTNGGGYTVARENLGRYASLLAAAALMIDYVLNVAVGISSGVGALISAVPALHPYMLLICLMVLVVIILANLRGTGEAGWAFFLPTYLFIVCFVGAIGWGVLQTITAGGHPQPAAAPPDLPEAGATVGLWLFLRAFASGCTAMTGVEAVSNGVGSFKRPVLPNAYRTLTIIVVVLGLLLAGVATLSIAYHVGAMNQTRPDYQTVLSQVLAATVGKGPFYYVAMMSLLCVLCLSANTSFVGFPRLCQMVAADGYLPRAFAMPGRRLVNTVGIVFLGGIAGTLLVVFGGVTDRLIPLFAIGAFLTFTISQAGMVLHWRRRDKGHPYRLAINAAGGLVTAAALLVVVIAKFAEGGWLVLAAVPLLIAVLSQVRDYYDRLEYELREPMPMVVDQLLPPTIVVVTKRWDKLSERAIKFALTLSPDVVAVHLSRLDGPDSDEQQEQLREQWRHEVEEPVAAAGLTPPRYMIIPAPYRELHKPLLELIGKLDAARPERTVAVLIPETIALKWWHNLLHQRRAAKLRAALLRDGGARVTVVSIPWRV
jgi:amino acid transporter